MPKIAIVFLLAGGLTSAVLGTMALAAPHDGATAGVQRRIDPGAKAWFERTIEHMLDESSSMADADAGRAKA